MLLKRFLNDFFNVFKGTRKEQTISILKSVNNNITIHTESLRIQKYSNSSTCYYQIISIPLCYRRQTIP